jgi:DNA helicase-2/ATP-dependent DNA helicase PcrA
MIRSFKSMLDTKNAYDIAFHVGKQTSFVKELFNDKSTEGVQRYENVQELLNSIKEFTETPMSEESGEVGDKGLATYLQQITLLTDADQKDPNADTVKLMTIHAAKGLEFPVVFVGGLEEGLFPSGLSINTREELEEERRLFYVAITRAKGRLYLTYANTRYKFGSLTANEPSRFIDEIPQDYLDRSFAGGGTRNQSSSGWANSNAFERMKGAGNSSGNSFARKPEPKPERTFVSSLATGNAKPKEVAHTPSANFVPSDIAELQIGSRVEHQKFGFGEVVKLEGSSHNPVATIKFDVNGEKKIMLNYAKLMIQK